MKVCKTLSAEEMVDEDWAEDLLNNYHQTLKSNGFNFCEIRYSGFYSQGDGASFTFKSVDVEQFIKINSCASKYKRLLKAINNGKLQLTYESIIVTHHYVHYNTIGIATSKYIPDISEKKYNKINDEINELRGEIEEKRIELCKNIYNDLEQTYCELVRDIEELLREEADCEHKAKELFKKYDGELVIFKCCGKPRLGVVIGTNPNTTLLRIAASSEFETESGIEHESFIIILPINDCKIIPSSEDLNNKSKILAAYQKRYGEY